MCIWTSQSNEKQMKKKTFSFFLILDFTRTWLTHVMIFLNWLFSLIMRMLLSDNFSSFFFLVYIHFFYLYGLASHSFSLSFALTFSMCTLFDRSVWNTHLFIKDFWFPFFLMNNNNMRKRNPPWFLCNWSEIMCSFQPI